MLNSFRKWISRSWQSSAIDITSPQAYQLFAPDPTLSGVSITRHTVFALPAFLRGVDLIASTCAALDVYPYKTNKAGGKEVDKEHASYNLLTRKPNQWQTPFEFKRELISTAIWAGNSYAFVEIDETTAKPVSLTLLDPEHTWPIIIRSTVDPSNVQLRYITEIDGKEIAIDPSEMIHLKGLGQAQGFMGMRLIDVVKESLGLGICVIKYGAVYFKHSGNPSMIVEFPEWMRDKEQIEQFRSGFAHMHQGVSNAHKLAVLQGGAKLAKNTVSNEDAQFLESRKMTLVDVALILGLPPFTLGAEANTGVYGNLAMENLSLIQYSFNKWLCNCEEIFERVLLTEVEKLRDSRSISFDRGKLLEADHPTNIKNWTDLVNNGLCLPNDACAALNLPLLDDDNNECRIPSNVKIQGEEPPPAPPVPPAPPALLAQNGQQGPPEGRQDDGKQQDGKSPADKPEDAQRLAKLTGSVLTRFVARLAKAGGKDLAKHREILVETLSPITDRAEQEADAFLRSVSEELSAVLPEQAKAVLDKINVAEWTERILND